MNITGKNPAASRLERMRASPMWRGGKFCNIYPILPGLRDPNARMPPLRKLLFPEARRVPRRPLPAVEPFAVWNRPPDSGLRVTWLGHSTVVIEIDGFRVLTDPMWSKRASPVPLLGPKRFQPVPVALDRLPPLDAVILSHDHYDHLDRATIRQLARLQTVPFVTSLGVGARLEAWGMPPERVVELDWWQSHDLEAGGLRLTAAAAQHFSGRSLSDRNSTLWSSFVMSTDRHAVFFSGDTGLTMEYGTIAERLGPFDLVMLEIGGRHPAWGDMHLGPENALKAWAMLGKASLMPIHWGTFSLALHNWDEPAETLLRLGEAAATPLIMPRLGQPVEPAAPLEPVIPWWRAALS